MKLKYNQWSKYLKVLEYLKYWKDRKIFYEPFFFQIVLGKLYRMFFILSENLISVIYIDIIIIFFWFVYLNNKI